MQRFLPRIVKRPRESDHSTPTADSRDSSPEPEMPAPKRLRSERMLTEAQLQKMEKNFGREIEKAVEIAKENHVVMPGFNFEIAKKGGRRAKAQQERVAHEWMDEVPVPRMAVSQDGYAVVVHLPGIMKAKSCEILLDELLALVEDGFGGKLPMTGGADGEGRNGARSYKTLPGQVAGICKLVRAWLPVGHPHGKPTASRDMLKSGKAFAASVKLMAQLRLVSHRVNVLIRSVDPNHHDQLQHLNTVACDTHEFYRALASVDPLLMEGREVMYNRQTPLHPDNADPKNGWAVLVVVGPFTGGPLYIPKLKLRMSYTDGTMIMVRGRVLPHEVEAFSDGQRVAIAHFTHETFWKKFGMKAKATRVQL